MKKSCFLLMLFCGVSSHNLFAANSSQILITSIEARDSGLHDLYFNATVPSTDCQLTDRAAIQEGAAGAKTMLSVALAAMVSGKKIIIEVNGCISNRPNIIRLQIFN